MTIEQIRNICIKASKIYYNYLEENEKGIYDIAILYIEKIDKNKLKLNIRGKIFDEEMLIFKHLATNTEYAIDSIKIQVYDKNTNTIIIKPSKDIYIKIANANVNDWLIISDLKFLITRVKEWYELNGNNISLPKNSSSLKSPDPSIFFKEDSPSSEQIKALDIIFNTPLTYIWGAPGTGKTQFVLSYAILHYLANKKRVMIVAPTNHALEQIYRGVIKMTDKAGVNRNKILRLGGPSKKFADEFPEVCEIIGLEKQLKQINTQISIIENILDIDETSKKESILVNGLELIEELKLDRQKINNLNDKCLNNVNKIDTLESKSRELELKVKSIERELTSLEKKKNSILYAIFSIFTKKVDFTYEINDRIAKQVEYEKQIKSFNKLKEEFLTKNKKVRALLLSVSGNISSQLSYLNRILKDVGEIEISLENLHTIENILYDKINEIENKKSVYSSLADEYKQVDKNTLEENYIKLKNERDRLSNYSTEQRIKNVSIIGATLDTYLYRYKEEKLNVDHIFLDEAGYSNIIKAMTLFNQNVPVTFLGDHMQLPPVCEISKQDIQRNEEFRPVMVWDQSAIYLEDLFKHDELNTIVHRYINSSIADFDQLKKSNLTKTFRFGKSLANVLQKHVYPEGFSSNLKEETNVLIYKVQNPSYNTNGTRLNKAEVEAISSLIRNNFDEESNVAILAPYSAQISALTNILPEYQKQNRILTVHKSQGQEWDTVIYSVCDIGNGKRPWFTDSQKALSNGLNNINTAISRSKKNLIMVCNPDEWKFLKGQLITDILNTATKIIEYDS